MIVYLLRVFLYSECVLRCVRVIHEPWFSDEDNPNFKNPEEQCVEEPANVLLSIVTVYGLGYFLTGTKTWYYSSDRICSSCQFTSSLTTIPPNMHHITTSSTNEEHDMQQVIFVILTFVWNHTYTEVTLDSPSPPL